MSSDNICPVGKFSGAKPVSYAFGRSNNDSLFVKIRFEITVDETRYYANHTGYFTEKTWERTQETLKFCGWDGRSPFPDLVGFGSCLPSVEVEHEEINDGSGPAKVFASIKWVNSGNDLRLKDENKATESDIRRLNAMFGLSSRGGSRPAQGQPRSPGPDQRGRGVTVDNRRDQYDRSNRPQGSRGPSERRDSDRPPPGRASYSPDDRGGYREDSRRQKGDPGYDEFDHRRDTFQGGYDDDGDKPPF